jgi:hypothetical protein
MNGGREVVGLETPNLRQAQGRLYAPKILRLPAIISDFREQQKFLGKVFQKTVYS